MTDLNALEKNVPILSVEHLKKNFGEHEVLRDITFDVPQGDVVSIIGSSGSGKSTHSAAAVSFRAPASQSGTPHVIT